MAKTHSFTTTGGIVALLLGATALQNVDAFTDNVRSFGGGVKEIVCVAQDLTGGMVQVFQGCELASAPATEAPASSASSSQGS